MLSFANPSYFWLLLLLFPMIVWHFFGKRHEAKLKVATTAAHLKRWSLYRILRHIPFCLRVLAIALVIIVLARPQTSAPQHEKEVEGINIIMCMDVSTSMMLNDIEPNRIEAAKKVAIEFIADRKYDNIGLTLFAGESFTQCPPTTDHRALATLFSKVNCDMAANGIISDGTAIGMGLANAVGRISKAKGPSKVIILLTDGANNCGDITPLMAAELAKEKGIRVYTISVGTQGPVRVPVAMLPDGSYYYQTIESDADPETLKQIAAITGGIYYSADSESKLRAIYDDIDKLEKNKLETQNYQRHYEAYEPFAWAALALVLLELLLRILLLRRLPE